MTAPRVDLIVDTQTNEVKDTVTGKVWGTHMPWGGTLPCCGCTFAFGRKAVVCETCRCHDNWRIWYGAR